MFQVLSLMSKLVFAPVWVLWKGYNLLWWAFEGFGRPIDPAPSDPERGNAFEVTDSRPREADRPAPIGLLRGGFIASMAGSGFYGLVSRGMVESHTLHTDRGWAFWACATGLTVVASIFAVRHVAEVRARRRSMAARVRDSLFAGAKRAVKAGSSVGGAVAQAVRGVSERVSGASPSEATCATSTQPNPVTGQPISPPAEDAGPFGGFASVCSSAACASGRNAKRIAIAGARAGRAAVAGVRHAAVAYKASSNATV